MQSPSSTRRIAAAALVAALTTTALAGCASVDLSKITGKGSNDGTAEPGFVVPSGMVLPTPLPTAQPTTLPKVKIGMPSVTGYQAVPQPTDAPTDATTERPDAEVTSRTWASADPLCTVQVDVTRSKDLLVTGGDDRHLSMAWSEGLAKKYKRFQEEKKEPRQVANADKTFTGLSIDFTATVLNSDVTGRSFVRAFSATGTLLSVTETCSGKTLDENAWNQVLGGLSLDPADDLNWPGAGANANSTASPIKSS